MSSVKNRLGRDQKTLGLLSGFFPFHLADSGQARSPLWISLLSVERTNSIRVPLTLCPGQQVGVINTAGDGHYNGATLSSLPEI